MSDKAVRDRDSDDAGEAHDVVAECELDEPREKVFRALTDPDIVDDWLDRGDKNESIERELIETRPHELVRYSWRSVDDERVVDSVVTFTLDDVPGGGTRLRVVHGDFVVRDVVAVGSADFTMRRAA